MTVAHYKGGHHPGNDLGLHYTALPPIVASCSYSDQLLVTRKFWSPGANRPSQASSSESFFTVPARCSISNLPVSVEPVKASLRMIGVRGHLASDLRRRPDDVREHPTPTLRHPHGVQITPRPVVIRGARCM